MTNNNSMDDIFDLEPITSTEIVVVDAPRDNADSFDMETARQNIHHLIQKGNIALDEMISLAKQSQHPRAFETVTGLIKTLADVNKDLIDLQQKKKQLSIKDENAPTNGQPAEVINNNLFVGSTQELQEMLENIKK